MPNEPKRTSSVGKWVLIVLGVAFLCCGGPLLATRLLMPNVWELFTVSAEDLQPPTTSAAGVPAAPDGGGQPPP